MGVWEGGGCLGGGWVGVGVVGGVGGGGTMAPSHHQGSQVGEASHLLLLLCHNPLDSLYAMLTRNPTPN